MGTGRRVTNETPAMGRLVRWLVGIGVCTVVGGAGGSARAEPASKVVLNGVPTPVFFNDGDSFRILSGRFEGMKARLGGYNTLESYGVAHQWGDWTAKEMFVLAKMATMHARRGSWSCTSDMKTDTYGRTLWWCPGLAEDLIRQGLAHVLSVDSGPGDAKLVAAQQEAIAARRGIWSHGVPDYVLTSLHSMAEDAEGDGAYNRLVSTVDGHSLKWIHDEIYDECQTVCDDGADTKARIDGAVEALKADPTVAAYVSGAGGARPYTKDELGIIASDAARGKALEKHMKKPEHLAGFKVVLDRLVGENKLGRKVGEVKACMIYVDFKRRFGGGRAACLR